MPWQAAKSAQAEHKAAKEQVKQCGLAVNSAKREIDHVTSALGAKRAEGAAEEADVLDSEEHQLVQTLKAAKIKFRRYFRAFALQLSASDVSSAANSVEAAVTSEGCVAGRPLWPRA